MVVGGGPGGGTIRRCLPHLNRKLLCSVAPFLAGLASLGGAGWLSLGWLWLITTRMHAHRPKEGGTGGQGGSDANLLKYEL